MSNQNITPEQQREINQRALRELEPLLARNVVDDDQPLYYNLVKGKKLILVSGTAVIAQVGIWLLAAVIWSGILSKKLMLFSLHPLLNSTGLLLSTQAILLLQPTSTPVQKKRGAVYHSSLNGLGAAFLLAGASVIIYNKSQHHGIHFESLHARLGLAVYLLFLTQGLIGALAFYAPGVFGGVDNAKALYKYHRISGYLTFVLSLVTVAAATQTPWNQDVGHIKLLPIAAAALILLIGLGSRVRPSKLGFGSQPPVVL
ncbi:hypothetical protein HKX48_001209 [Thoreauomyces humboldtii]|nr:hypothetical protein HKX48_001209 [Thoreauomyces humboldtii]